MDAQETLLAGPSTASYLLRLTPALKAAAERRAASLGLTLADVTRLALACYLEPDRQRPPEPFGELDIAEG